MYKDPFEYMKRMQEEIDESFDRFFGRGYGRKMLPSKTGEGEGALAVREPLMDLKDKKDHYEVVMEMPGLDKEDIDINVSDDYLTVSAEVREEKEEKKEDYYFKERSYGSFQRSMTLPGEVVPDKTSAEYKKGVLKIKLAKKQGTTEKQHRISVQ